MLACSIASNSWVKFDSAGNRAPVGLLDCFVLYAFLENRHSWAALLVGMGGPRKPEGSPEDFGMPVGAQKGYMKAPDGPGEAPAGRSGGCKMLNFSFVFTVV